jgi:hypothetical protein
VSVNLDPVDARWQHHGNSMSSAIKAPLGVPGPWVVRVEVVDETGVVIGRDFLEVVSSPRKFGSTRSVARR